MVELNASYWVFTALGVLVTFIEAVLSIFLLYKYAIDLKVWKKIEYQFIMIRVVCDIFNGFAGCGYFVSSSFTLLHPEIVPFDATFLIGLVGSNFLEMRSFMAAIIAVERAIATLIPLKYYHYRRQISNVPVIGFILSTGLAVDVVLFGFCGFRLPLPQGCLNYACATPECYLIYAGVTKMIYGILNASFSILLCAKLFFLSWRHSTVPTDLRKANWISLTDGMSTLIFDVLPTMVFDSRFIDIRGYGPVVGVLRQSGRAVEAIVMVYLLERKKIVQPARITHQTNMVFLSWAYWFFSAVAISMLFTMVHKNLFILYKYTLEYKTWKKLEYQLILLRVSFDVLNGITGFTFVVISVINQFHDFVPYNISTAFGIASFNLMEMRCFLAAIIAVERVLATTFPLKFHRCRSKISNLSIISCIVSLGVAADIILFGICGYRFDPVPGCTNFTCATPSCFQKYTSATRLIYTITNFVFSIILCNKLFWLSLNKTQIAIDIRKANLLSLTDGFSALVFELIPWCISYYGIVDTKPLGSFVGAFRSTGRVLEAYVMLKLMKKEVTLFQSSRISISRN